MRTSTYDQIAPFHQLAQLETRSSSVFVPETLHLPDPLHERVDEYVDLRMSRKFHAADISAVSNGCLGGWIHGSKWGRRD